ncbi:1512_t:CDS:2, partial [Funneliformis geosporum]
MRNCANCHKDLSLTKLTNYEAKKDLLICVQCYFKQKEKYSGYSVNHFPLLKRNGEVDGSSEAIVVCNDNNFLNSNSPDLSPAYFGFLPMEPYGNMIMAMGQIFDDGRRRWNGYWIYFYPHEFAPPESKPLSLLHIHFVGQVGEARVYLPGCQIEIKLREIEQERLKPTFSAEKQEAKIINCRVSRGKLITQLNDGREISILVDLLTKKRILGENVKPDQLKNPELKSE